MAERNVPNGVLPQSFNRTQDYKMSNQKPQSVLHQMPQSNSQFQIIPPKPLQQQFPPYNQEQQFQPPQQQRPSFGPPQARPVMAQQAPPFKAQPAQNPPFKPLQQTSLVKEPQFPPQPSPLLNGMHSLQSSCNSSPSMVVRPIPSSQLPANSMQANPSPITALTNKLEQVQLSGGFATSTPNQTLTTPSAFSPLTPSSVPSVVPRTIFNGQPAAGVPSLNGQNQINGYPPPQWNRYPTPMKQPEANNFQQNYGVANTGFDKYWGRENYDLLQTPNILPSNKVEPTKVCLGQEALDAANCSPDVFRCTMTKIPDSSSLLQKSRLPLGILIHPFRDLSHLPIIQCNVIVRCRACRNYINPFVFFVDSKRWKCNLCYRINELPEEFQYDPVSKTYGDPSRRPEIKCSTIEYIAPAEYMLRPPQPAIYLFLLDISRLAIESGYLQTVCGVLLEELKTLPGDARTQVGFLAYDSSLHFYSLAEGLSQPHEMIVVDVEDVFLPTPDNLLANLKDRMDLITDLLMQFPTKYEQSYDSNSVLGAALQAAYKMIGATGGRVTVFQASLPNSGPGALVAREDPSQRANANVSHLTPANDFYKRLSLECSGQQIAVDMFVLNSQYVDMATISDVVRFSGGCLYHFPLFKANRVLQNMALTRSLRRYLTRKIGFEAVMRVRCTRGLSIHTFHGNCFVRSTDLLSLPNINPDSGFGMQISIDESLSDVQSVSFQAALLYTSSKGERRIRVHTLCVPVASTLHDIIHSADQQCIVGLLAKMAVDRSIKSNLSDAREAFINVAIDILSSYKLSLNMDSSASGLLAPNCLKLLPLYISALLKNTAFRVGTSTRLDDRFKAMHDMKTKPLYMLIQNIYPDLFAIHDLEQQPLITTSEDSKIPMPPRLQLTARCLDNKGVFLMDTGEHIIILVCPNVAPHFLQNILGVNSYNDISDQLFDLPVLPNQSSQLLQQFLEYLNEDKPFAATIQIIRDNSPNRQVFFERLVEDRVENALSYHEFLQHLKTQVK